MDIAPPTDPSSDPFALECFEVSPDRHLRRPEGLSQFGDRHLPGVHQGVDDGGPAKFGAHRHPRGLVIFIVLNLGESSTVSSTPGLSGGVECVWRDSNPRPSVP